MDGFQDDETQEAIRAAVLKALPPKPGARQFGEWPTVLQHPAVEHAVRQMGHTMSTSKPSDRYPALPPLYLPSPTPRSEMLDVQDTDIFDSLYLGNGADGDVVLFQRPRGSSMVLLGEGFDPDLDINHTQVTTSMISAGQLGPLGDGAIRTISARLCGPGATPEAINQLLEKASLQLKICDKIYFESTLQNVYAEKPEEGRTLKVAIKLGRADPFQVRLHLDAPLRLDAPVRLLINLKTLLAKDVR